MEATCHCRSRALRDRCGAALGTGLQLLGVPPLRRALGVLLEHGGFRLASPADATFAYRWNGRSLAFHHCKSCGCTTHLQAVDDAGQPIVGINARLILGLDPATPRAADRQRAHGRVLDALEPSYRLPGRHPKMADPESWL